MTKLRPLLLLTLPSLFTLLGVILGTFAPLEYAALCGRVIQ